MYKIKVMNPCSCFIKKGFADSEAYATKDEAKRAATELLEYMQTKFCHKHDFSIVSQFGSYTIYTKSKG
jgi:nucleoid DNA-binding protein